MKSLVVFWPSYKEFAGKQVYWESKHLEQLLPHPVSLPGPGIIFREDNTHRREEINLIYGHIEDNRS